jgi:serine/threonine-protein kinase
VNDAVASDAVRDDAGVLPPAGAAPAGAHGAARLTAALAGRYTLHREVGRGGMATVYVADDHKHGRQVAVKVLRPESTAAGGGDRFAREIRVVARLQHPHILPLYDSGEVDGLLYFVMPYVDGESLRVRLDRGGALALEEATRLVRQVADALDYAHARGVVHRDVKPENILLAGAQALLADFGIARAAAAESADRGTLTTAGVSLGTPAYMSPEQAAAEPRVDGRSDVYSLGCVAYEALAGAAPFRGPGVAALMAQHVLRPPPALVGGREPLPAAAAEAVHRALAKDPAERFAAAGDFATALERALAEARDPSPSDLRLRAVERQQAARRRVLVLEFANIAGAADADWLSTGIAETLGADLNQIAGIRAVAQDAATRRRTEAARQGRVVDVEQAVASARAEGARWVVWGGFQKLGARIRITTHLAGSDDGAVIHEAKLDGVMDDIFALQDRIVTGLADALGVRPTGVELERIRQPETTDLTAYEHYARGYREYMRFGKESVRAALEHFRAAIALDPQYALAYAGLGVAHGPQYIATGRREVLDEGAALLERALALDPSIGEAYAWLAYLQFRQGRFDDAERTARRGVEREPAQFMSWYMLGCSLTSRAVTLHRPADLARAVPPFLRSIAINPTFHPAHMALGSIYLLRGTYGHAAALIDRAVAMELDGGGLQFLGALVQRAVLHIGAGALAPAAPLLDAAIARYTGADHVYAEMMSVYAHWARGCLAERTGAWDRALADFGRAGEIADAYPHRINIGVHWVKARFGLARVLHRLGRASAAEEHVREGCDVLATRGRFVWTWFVGGTDAEMWYELASTLAAFGRSADALTALTRAADAGWADVTWLRHDPAFTTLRDDADVQRLCAGAASRVALPPPAGSGGLP